MNDQTREQPSRTRRLTDTALIIIAVVAVASWVWRRVRGSADYDTPPIAADDLAAMSTTGDLGVTSESR